MISLQGAFSTRGADALLTLLIFSGANALAWEDPPRPIVFEEQILPIFKEHCLECHAGESPAGGLSLQNIQSLVDGGQTGRVVTVGQSQQSYLYHLVKRGDMPRQPGRRISDAEVETIRSWIDHGLVAHAVYEIPEFQESIGPQDRQHWAYRQLAIPALPRLDRGLAARGPVDLFILRKLSRDDLTLAPLADDRTLLRRLYLDLVGVPPTPAQQRAFAEDASPDVYARRVDRLLASPQFGVRWGRYWLDLAGYSDTVGFDHNPTHIIVSEGKWKYRDYVIDALNRDLRYDEFVRQQLAGDQLVAWKDPDLYYSAEIREHLVATGFLRTARDQTHEGVGVITQNFYNVLHDTTEIVTSSLLGLTVKCARCHDHKFDAIKQRDYYRIQSLLMPSYNPNDWRPVFPFVDQGKPVRDRTLADVSPRRQEEMRLANQRIEVAVKALQQEKQTLRASVRQAVTEKKRSVLPEPIRKDLDRALQQPESSRDRVQRYLVEKLAALVAVSEQEVSEALPATTRDRIASIDTTVAERKSAIEHPGKIQALYEIGDPPATFILTRGEFEFPGRPVNPGFISVLSTSERAAEMVSMPGGEGSRGRRLALANWLVAPDTPASALVTRVIVNRVWKHLLGRGLVTTTGDFGVQGAPPTHPGLLDWLSVGFQRHEWRIKAAVRSIVMSGTYRQASHVPESRYRRAYAIDPVNATYWRMPLRRLESEVIRDSLLAVTGRLNRSMGGPPVMLTTAGDGRIYVDAEKLERPAERWRRSIYLLTRRSYHHSLLDVFDQPDIETTCNRRQVNAVALQSLTMLNDPFVFDQALHLAEILWHPEDEVTVQLQRIYARILCRPADAQELTACRAAYSRLIGEDRLAPVAALAEICHTLLNASEFLYRE